MKKYFRIWILIEAILAVITVFTGILSTKIPSVFLDYAPFVGLSVMVVVWVVFGVWAFIRLYSKDLLTGL